MTEKRRVKPVYLLFWLAVASPLLAFWPSGQDPAATDWAKEVERACTASRYGLRLAAGRKVAAAGAAAVPAIRAYEQQVGRAKIPANLVEAVADATPLDAPVVALLLDWATDRDFYWRGQAMRGLASRAPLLPDRAAEFARLFAQHGDDPAWLTRVHARFGLALLGGQAAVAEQFAREESDPRARPRLAALLLAKGVVPPLQPLLDALGEERTFLGNPWGRFLAEEAHKALRSWLGEAHPKADGAPFDSKEQALELLTAAVRTKSGQAVTVPTIRSDGDEVFTGGFEILSCKFGDRFVRWTDAGELHYGLTGGKRYTLTADAWQPVWQKRTTLPLAASHGEVVCDSLQLVWQEPAVRAKIAPQALPEPVAEWLKQLVALLEESDAELAATLRVGVGQFAPR